MLPYNLSTQEENVLSDLYYNDIHFSITFKEKSTNYFYKELKIWLSGEFDLYFQETDRDALKIYFPNGLITVLLEDNENLKIISKNKMKLQCKKIMIEVLRSYNRFKIIKL
ncbi:hypothetical protein SAMN04489761_1515 [Tenacibaculum sp. MAR_2009_124]|uniref:hypothetical protein n=1 Tax=Tenacibaculum sp. MAR_2009_124 TaxID=1250059 RepID=UPI00089B7938|nr:hypothetical protein [Tenacibaculum sp. MAR_2009_124]SEB70692.1 hypothetical protein SAMN04489761_1515 [Tenacibaculum sp. MAR_2009_124]